MLSAVGEDTSLPIKLGHAVVKITMTNNTSNSTRRHGMTYILPCQWTSGRWGGGKCCGGGLVGYRSALMGSAYTPLLYCLAQEKWEMSMLRVVQKKIERGCKVKSSKKSIVKVVEWGFPNINAQGYIIYLFANIFRASKRYCIVALFWRPVVLGQKIH